MQQLSNLKELGRAQLGECLLSMHKALGLISATHKPGVALCHYDLSILEAETEGPKFKVILAI